MKDGGSSLREEGNRLLMGLGFLRVLCGKNVLKITVVIWWLHSYEYTENFWIVNFKSELWSMWVIS